MGSSDSFAFARVISGGSWVHSLSRGFSRPYRRDHSGSRGFTRSRQGFVGLIVFSGKITPWGHRVHWDSRGFTRAVLVVVGFTHVP